MLVTVLTVVDCDGSPGSARAVGAALASALTSGGPAVLPLPTGPAAVRARLVAALRPDAPARPDTAMVVATSGSTGRPKGVELSAAALRASATATHDRLGGPGRWLLALPAQHIAGAQVLVRSLLAGHEPAVLDLRGGFTPEGFAAAAGAMPPSGRRYTALVPTQLVRLLDADRGPLFEGSDGSSRSGGSGGSAGSGGSGGSGGSARSGGSGRPAATGLEELRRFDAVLVGGAACPPALLDRARDAGVRVVTTYGMSETAGGCVYDGRPLNGVQVRITGDGRIELAGPTLALGYRLAPADSGAHESDATGADDAGADKAGTDAAGGADTARAGTDEASPARAGAGFRDGWFRTDDAGRFGPDGTLEVIGRLDDVIVTGGHKVAPAAVERALAAVPGVGDVCVVGLPDAEWGQLVAAAVVPRDAARPPESAALHGAARDLAGPAAGPKLIRLVPGLPLRGPGKVDRAAVRRLLSDGP